VQDLESVSGQLRSLTGQCLFASDDLLQQVFKVGAELTSLVLYQSGERSELWVAGRLPMVVCRALP
jgi:hypothetical protein